MVKSETLSRNWIGYLCNEKYQTLSTVLFWPGSKPLNLRVVCVSACLHMEKPGGESRTRTGGRVGGSVYICTSGSVDEPTAGEALELQGEHL